MNTNTITDNNNTETKNEITENTMLKSALAYAAQGIAVFPCTSKNGAKKPLTKNGFKNASTDPGVITEWWTKNPDALIGAPTGETANFIVLDIDCKNKVNGFISLDNLIVEHGPLPATRRVSTPSGGEHVYFKHPGSKVKTNAGILAPGVDVRGDGGYIILPPSKIDENCYSVLDDEPIAEAPDWLIQLVCPKAQKACSHKLTPKTANTRGCATTTRYGARVVHAEYQRVASCPEGTRNSQLNKSAYALGQLVAGGEIAEEEAQDALKEAASACGLIGAEAIKTIRSGLAAGKLKPWNPTTNNLSGKSGRSGNPGKGACTNNKLVSDSSDDQSDLSDNSDDNTIPKYITDESGIYFIDMKKDGRYTKVFLGPPMEFLAIARDMDETQWSYLVAWKNPDGNRQELLIPYSSLSCDSKQWLASLCDRGWLATTVTKHQSFLKEFIRSQNPNKRIRIIKSVGWTGDSFVLPDKVIGKNADDEFHYVGGANPAFATKGTLEGWQQSIGQQARENSRLMFAISASFAAPLLNLLGIESGGINFFGRSSSGKSTTLRAGASVWGAPSAVYTWRSTANGLEGMLVKYNDLTLCMDELGQATTKDVGEIVYMISNGRGKSRANKDGSARTVKEWRCVVLSSGELTILDKIQEGGQRHKAGQEVRFLDIPADSGKDMGIFECLHHYSSPKDFADAIQKACAENYGIPGRVFVSELVESLPDKLDEIRKSYNMCTAIFAKPNVSSQIQRVSSRFAIYALAGAMAANFGVVPWQPREAILAAQQCFEDWLLNRGETIDKEVSQVLDHLRLFIAQYGSSKFQRLESGTQIIPERVGFKRKISEEETEYIFLKEQLQHVYKGFNFKQVITVLDNAKWIKRPEKDRGLKTKITISELGRPRCYVIVPRDEMFEECAA